jgi:hypothetical protein
VGLQIILDSVKAQVENLDNGQCKAGERDARPGQDACGEGGASPMARPCDRRVSARLSVYLDLCIFGSSVYLLRHTMPRKAALSAEATDIPSLIGPVLLASTTSAMVDTAKDAVKTVKKAFPATRRRPGDVSDESEEAKRVSMLMSTPSPSDLRHDCAFLFVIARAVSIARLGS